MEKKKIFQLDSQQGTRTRSFDSIKEVRNTFPELSSSEISAAARSLGKRKRKGYFFTYPKLSERLLPDEFLAYSDALDDFLDQKHLPLDQKVLVTNLGRIFYDNSFRKGSVWYKASDQRDLFIQHDKKHHMISVKLLVFIAFYNKLPPENKIIGHNLLVPLDDGKYFRNYIQDLSLFTPEKHEKYVKYCKDKPMLLKSGPRKITNDDKKYDFITIDSDELDQQIATENRKKKKK